MKLKAKHFTDLGIAPGPVRGKIKRVVVPLVAGGRELRQVLDELRRVAERPDDWKDDATWGKVAEELGELARRRQPMADETWQERPERAPYRQWGQYIDSGSITQIQNACRLPIAVRGALMPDAHIGYGLPIGGVLSTRGAVIPYAVGVDIACRMKLSVLDLPLASLEVKSKKLERALERETRFGIGAKFTDKRDHDVMDRDWGTTPLTRRLKDKAWSQLGTSGSGNHFVEFGVFEPNHADAGLEEGRYLALLSHSGSRGAGATVADHYSKLAMSQHPELPKELRHLSWLDLETEEGQEYWRAMELMGLYAEANHACIHRHVARHLGAEVLLDVENHHNFAWREVHDGEEVVVHRKGATPASEGVLGIIPGSMADPAYLVRGRGSGAALDSAAHGAGRVMSRKQAKKTLDWKDAQRLLDRRRVKLLSAGLDEVPMVYKNIDVVMSEQQDLVETLGRFEPRLVKMAPAGERPED